MLMSFYGSIGHIMASPGLEIVFETAYGENAVKDILTGKDIARANRAHILTESTLMISLQQQNLIKNIDFDLNGIRKLYEKVKSDQNVTIDNMDSSCLDELYLLVDDFKNYLREKSRTVCLWLQYMDYVELCRLFICAVRTANWSQYLITTGKILNFFAATGHKNYAKSARMYLQMMMNLEKEYPCLYKWFNDEGLFVVRRSEQYWAGI